MSLSILVEGGVIQCTHTVNIKQTTGWTLSSRQAMAITPRLFSTRTSHRAVSIRR